MMKKEYILRVIFNDADDEIELLTEYCDDIDCDCESETVVFEVEGDELDIPKSMIKALKELDSDILGLS
tara:strand:- start:491 stop:697 length:207 start_codon:yes stop_codon:yes gene_type:complete